MEQEDGGHKAVGRGRWWAQGGGAGEDGGQREVVKTRCWAQEVLGRPYLVASGILTHEGFVGSRKLGSVVIDINDLDCNGNFGFLVLFVCGRGNTEMRQKQENPSKQTNPQRHPRKDQIC